MTMALLDFHSEFISRQTSNPCPRPAWMANRLIVSPDVMYSSPLNICELMNGTFSSMVVMAAADCLVIGVPDVAADNSSSLIFGLPADN